MLSYQHSYHAGNMADVHKHAALCWSLAYLTRKDKPLSYIETHAGRGLYRLDSPEALKTGEAAAGIMAAEERIAPDHPYRQRLHELRKLHGQQSYAGSPLLAALSLRPGDRMHLGELHPQEFAALAEVMRPHGATCHNRDGFELALSLCPPTPRRGLMLIDPSYEVKAEYQRLPGLIRDLHRRWNVGVLMLWYPILASDSHKPMLRALETALPDALRHEVSFGPARAGHRMTGSGLFVVNPPFGLAEELASLSEAITRQG